MAGPSLDELFRTLVPPPPTPEAKPVETPKPPPVAATPPKPAPAPKPAPVAATPKPAAPPKATVPKPAAPPKATVPKPAPAPKPPTPAPKPTPVATTPPTYQIPSAVTDILSELPKAKTTGEGLPSFSAYVPAGQLVEEAKKAKVEATKGEPTGLLSEEKRALTEGVEEVAKPLAHLVKQGANLRDIWATEAERYWAQKFYEATPSDVFFGAPKEFGKELRERTREAADAAERRFQEASDAERKRLEEEQKKREAARPSPLVDEYESRRLAKSILKSTTVKGNPARDYYERRVQQLLVGWDAEKETDAAKYKELSDLAEQKTLAELVDLYTRGGMRQFSPDLALGEEQGRWKVSEALPAALPIPPSSKAVLSGALSPLDTALGMAFRPQRKVMPSGTVARGESSVGYVLNTVLGATDYVTTTGLDALIEQEAPTLDKLTKNVDARRDPITWQIENDEKIQGDITSGEPWRVTRALYNLAPVIALTLVSPDIVTSVKTIAKIPGIAMDAARASARMKEVSAAVQAAEKGQRAAVAVEALKKVAKEVKDAKETEKVAREAARKAEFASEAARLVEKAVDIAEGDYTSAIQLLDSWNENAIAMRLRDDVSARLHADPDIAAYVYKIGGSDQPNLPSDVLREIEGLPEGELADRAKLGAQKYKAALQDAERAAVQDFMQQAGGAKLGEVRREDIVPRPAEVSEEELGKAFGPEVTPAAAPTPEAPKATAPAPTPVAPTPAAAPTPAPTAPTPTPAAPTPTPAPTAPTPAAPPKPPAPVDVKQITPKMAKQVGEARTLSELVTAIGKLPEGARDVVARRFGAVDFASLKKTAKIDVAASAEKARKLEEQINKANDELIVEADNLAALKAEPELAKADAAARKTYMEKEAARKEAVANTKNVTANQKKLVSKAMAEQAKAEALLAKKQAVLDAARAKLAPVEKQKPKRSDKEAFLAWLDKADPYQLRVENAQAAVAEAQAAVKTASESVAAATEVANKAVAEAVTAEKTAQEAATAAMDAYTKRAAPGRSVAALPPSGQRFFSYVGEPIYMRGYTDRPPMKYVAGKRAHLLDRALDVDAQAVDKYLSGEGVVDFAANLGNVEHVGVAAPNFKSATKGSFAEYRVIGPDGKAVGYNPVKFKDPNGLPTQRDYKPIITWKDQGNKLWKWAEEVAKKNPSLPRAKTMNEYLRSLVAYADPTKKAKDVDLIRLDDTVYVSDAELAKQIGPIEQPILDVDGKTPKIASAVSEGFPAKVVGFRIAADGTPVPILRPQNYRSASGALVDAGKGDIEVSPSSLVYVERGRISTEAGQRPYSNNDWDLLNKREKAMLGDSTPLRYSDKSRFPQLAPPKRPTPEEFNYNPDAARNYFTDAERAAIKAEMDKGAAPTTQRVAAPKGQQYEKKVADYEQKIAKRKADIAELQTQLDAERLTPQQVADLETAVGKLAPEYEDIGARMTAQAAYEQIEPESLVLPARGGVEALVSELEQRQRVMEASAQQSFGQRMNVVAQRLSDLGKPRKEVEEQSLLPMARDLKRTLEGQARRVNAELARAVRTIDPKATVPNLGAAKVLMDYIGPFRSALLSENAQRSLIEAALVAYAKEPNVVTDAQKAFLAEKLVVWARSGEGVEALRDALISGTRTSSSPMRALQEGDIHLAYAVSTEGIWRKTVADAKIAGIALPKDLADAANATVNGIFGLQNQGGRPSASLGFAVLANVMVPEEYRKPIETFADIAKADLYEPLVPATSPSLKALPKGPPAAKTGTKVEREAADATARAEWVTRMRELLQNTDALMTENLYVPRPLRDALDRQIRAVEATARIGGSMTLIAADFWKQAVVLGTATPMANQYWMDFYGNLAGAYTAGVSRGDVSKVLARSVFAQFLSAAVPGVSAVAPVSVGQALAGVDKLRSWWRNEAVATGTTAREAVAALSRTPEIHAIMARDANFKIGKYTAAEIHDAWSEAGVFEAFSSEQLTRTVNLLVSRNATPMSGAYHLFQANQNVLQDLANLAATRQRVALAYTLLESGVDLEEAGRKTVEIVGDFAGELHPLEEKIISVLFPFWSYRKFNARRTMKALMSPYWLNKLDKGEEIGAQVVSWYLDDSDEFGFHTDSMEDEYDPEDFGKIREEVIAAHPDWSAGGREVQEEALRLAAVRRTPKAYSRYESMLRRLQEIQRTQGRKAAIAALNTDADAKVLAMYNSPDPVQLLLEGQDLLPEYHRDRYPIWLSENRNQALDSWYKANVGRYTKPGDEQIYMLFPGNPNAAGLAEVLSMAALGAAVANVGATAGLAAQRSVKRAVGMPVEPTAIAPDRIPALPALDGFLRDPRVQVLLSTGVGFAPGDRQSQAPRVIADEEVGKFFYDMGLAQKSVERERGVDVLKSDEGMTGAKYAIPSEVMNAMYLVYPVAASLLPILQLSDIRRSMRGEARRPTAEGSVEAALAPMEAEMGQRVFAVSPSMQEFYAKKEAEQRVQALAEEMPSAGTQVQIVDPSVITLRGMSAQEQSPTAQQEQDAAVLRALTDREMDPRQYPALRVYLRKNGYTDQQILAMKPDEIRIAVRKVAAKSLTE